MKQSCPMNSTDGGIPILVSAVQSENALSSMRDSLEPSSNVIVASCTHRQKQLPQRTSTDHGIQIDESDEQFPKTCDSIRESCD
jgi:hypothetical protein